MTLSPRSQVLAYLLLVAVLAVLVAALLLRQPDPVTIEIHPPRPTATPAPTATREPVLVYVTGEVANPETLANLPFGSRVSDAVAAAGGFTEAANQSLVNLAGRVRDGDHVHVPSIDVSNSELPTPSAGSRVYINTATQAELESLPDIGAVTARRIIEYRELVGDFADFDDLDQVSGIGPATLEKLQDLIAFD